MGKKGRSSPAIILAEAEKAQAEQMQGNQDGVRAAAATAAAERVIREERSRIPPMTVRERSLSMLFQVVNDTERFNSMRNNGRASDASFTSESSNS